MKTTADLSQETINDFRKLVPKSRIGRFLLALMMFPFALLYSAGAFADWYLSSGAADGEETAEDGKKWCHKPQP